MKDLRNTKIWIGDNPELSRKVQERLFQLGFRWGGVGAHVQQTEYHSLYLWNDKCICYGSTDTDHGRASYFDKDPRKEIHLWDLNLSSEGEYDENIGKEVIVKGAIFGQVSGKPGVIRDANGDFYYIYQPGIENTTSRHTPCVTYTKWEVKEWFSQPEKDEFKEGDYIVLLYPYGLSVLFERNRVYKVRQTYPYLMVSEDEEGDPNGWESIQFSDKDRWRYATPSEIARYDAAGGPCDSDDEFKEEWHLPEKWCVRITDENRRILEPWWEEKLPNNQDRVTFKGWLLSDKYDGTYVHWYCGNVPDDYTEITTEQFIKHVLKSDNMHTIDAGGSGYVTTPTTNGSQTITRSALKEIWEVAQEGCFWKTELRNIAKRDEFSDTVTLTLDEVERMYRDASVAQRRTLDQYLTRPVDDKNAFVRKFRADSTDNLSALSEELFGSSTAIEIIHGATPAAKPELKGRAFYVGPCYKVEIGDAEDGIGTYIAIFKK